MSVDLHMY